MSWVNARSASLGPERPASVGAREVASVTRESPLFTRRELSTRRSIHTRGTVAQRCRLSSVGDQTTMSRRERLRAETTAEIKEIALKLMAAGGPDAISLRAIARDMGMTAGAIYSYFATRDDLVSTLIA